MKEENSFRSEVQRNGSAGTGRDSHGPTPLSIASNPEGLTLRSPARGTSLTIGGRKMKNLFRYLIGTGAAWVGSGQNTGGVFPDPSFLILLALFFLGLIAAVVGIFRGKPKPKSKRYLDELDKKDSDASP
jgi:hypothetical protein